jgi:hypothetical protein
MSELKSVLIRYIRKDPCSICYFYFLLLCGFRLLKFTQLPNQLITQSSNLPILS